MALKLELSVSAAGVLSDKVALELSVEAPVGLVGPAVGEAAVL